MNTQHFYRALILAIVLILGLLPLATAAADAPAIWETAEAIRAHTTDAQRDLFLARRADDPDAAVAQAADAITQAQAAYRAYLEPLLGPGQAEAGGRIDRALAEAAAAVEVRDQARLGQASGHLWTGLLLAAYDGAVNALAAGDFSMARAWLRVREYRPATRITLVTNEAAEAVAAASSAANGIALDDALTAIHNDLLGTYTYLMRDAIDALEAALVRAYGIRAAEWAGQISGYFAIVETDFGSKQGANATAELRALLAEVEQAVLAGSFDAARGLLVDVRTALADYHPVTLTADQIAAHSQLLFVFTDLVSVEYRDGVRNGQITIAIEYQEALTFRSQAQRLYEELRPTIVDRQPQAADRLAALYADIEAHMNRLADFDTVDALVQEAKRIVEEVLPLDIDGSNTAAFVVVETLLQDVEQAIHAGRYADAEQTRLQSYALFDFGPEKRLLAFAPDMAFFIDALFWYGDETHPGLAHLIAEEAPPAAVEAAIADIHTALSEAQIVLGASSAPTTIVVNAAIIVFREGLEAVVIIAALSAGLARANLHLRKPLLLGALGAFLATLLTGVIANRLLSLFQANGEKLEAVVSLVAIAVLLLITNWFFHKVYWTAHLAEFHKQKREILKTSGAGQFLALVLLGFSSVYREGFETVLFLQALILDAGAGTVLQGVMLGLLLVMIVAFLTIMLQKRLPYMTMMVFTGVLIAAVLVIMIGKTARVMQVVGWLSITPITGVTIPYWLGQWFGVFATWEGLLLQAAAVGFVLGSYYLAEYRKKTRRRQRPQQASTADAARSS